eukprot:79857-Hanusia_phi.AAC.1
MRPKEWKLLGGWDSRSGRRGGKKKRQGQGPQKQEETQEQQGGREGEGAGEVEGTGEAAGSVGQTAAATSIQVERRGTGPFPHPRFPDGIETPGFYSFDGWDKVKEDAFGFKSSAIIIGSELFLNVTEGNELIMDLPKRLSENARRSDMYSKQDYDERLKRAKSKKHASSMAFVQNTIFPMGRRGIYHFDQRQKDAPHARFNNRLSVFRLKSQSGGGVGFGAKGSDNDKSRKEQEKKISSFSKDKAQNPGKYPEMQIIFTCNKCETRQSKIFTRMAYEKGVVIVKCDGCGVCRHGIICRLED